MKASSRRQPAYRNMNGDAIPTSVYKPVVCKFEGCSKHFTYVQWKTGIDKDYCVVHRQVMREREADELIAKNPALADDFAS